MARRIFKSILSASDVVTTQNGEAIDLEGAELFEVAYKVTDNTPSAVTCVTGAVKETTVTFPAKAAATDNDYIKLTDADGATWGIALSTAGVAEVAEITCIAEGSVAEKTQIVAIAEGSVKNVTQVTTVADGTGGPGPSLAGTSFKVYDAAGSVGIWFSVGGVPGSAPAAAAACDRQVEVALAADDTATQVAGKITTAFALDAALTVGNVNAVVTITDKAYGVRTAASDGTAGEATGFTIATTAAGHASNLHTKYFILKDEVGTVAFWFDVDNAGASAPVHGADRAVEISTVTSEMTAAQVATAVYNVIHADAKFNGVSDTSGTIVVVSTTYGNKTGQSAGDSGFTVTEHTAGVASALTGKYFVLRDVGGTVGVWFDVGNEGTSAPGGASGCTRAIEVNTVARGATAAQVATALAAVLDSDSKYAATAADTKVTVTQSELGVRVDAADGDTGFTFATTTQGSATGAGPTGAIWAAIDASRKVLVDISGCTDAPSVATAVESAFDALTGASSKMATTKSSGDIKFTREKPAVVGADVPKNADDSGAGSITSVQTTAGVASGFEPDSNVITTAAHGMVTGQKLALTINSGSLPTGLSATNYWAIVTGTTTFKLASSYVNAAAGTAVNFTDYGDAGKTATFTPASLSVGLTVEKSNDKVNWVTLTSEATKTGSGTTHVSYSSAAYPYIRLNISALTAGSCDIEANVAATTYL